MFHITVSELLCRFLNAYIDNHLILFPIYKKPSWEIFLICCFLSFEWKQNSGFVGWTERKLNKLTLQIPKLLKTFSSWNIWGTLDCYFILIKFRKYYFWLLDELIIYNYNNEFLNKPVIKCETINRNKDVLYIMIIKIM